MEQNNKKSMLRGVTTFVSDDCGHKFKGMGWTVSGCVRHTRLQ